MADKEAVACCPPILLPECFDAAADPDISLLDDWAKLRSMRIFLHISLRVLAIALAGTSHRNT